jgi:hypothetical protein
MEAFIYRKQIRATGKYYIGKHNGNNKWYRGSGTEYLKDYNLYVKNRKIDLIEEVLEYINDLTKINERETYWLKYYDAENNPLYYNKSNISHGCIVTTTETKNKQSLSSPFRKKVLQYDLEGNFIKEWECRQDAVREIGISSGDLFSCINGKQKTGYGFQWREWTENFPLKIESYIKQERSLESRLNHSNKMKGIPKPEGFGKHRYRIIYQFDKNGVFIAEYKSIREACLALNKPINPGEASIGACAHGKQKTAYGYVWSFTK